ncbi:c-type cytochrome biogenesis protein CcmI [Nitrococcus mobilis]|uniref:TPR repeat n=1 Tax=Nitrococcus mobilis Nb-231 TaxID=314278 RepID=A4BUK5_9GAMM|nr:c-type cytochrome biogenesis protein CcmI [Nitrococcus mobilis]EAR20571.1 TPR repeat [Nitrococcus mobilis Nb-231]
MSIVFWIIAALMTLLAILLIVAPIVRGTRRFGAGAAEANIAIYRRRIRELEEERDAGTISQQNFAVARAEIDRQLLDDVGEEAGVGIVGSRPRSRLPAVVVSLFLVPAVIGGFYAWNGLPNVPSGASLDVLHASAQTQMEFVEKQLAQLKAHLQQQPEDGKGWLVLGRAYMLLGRHQDAAVAFKKAQDALGDSAPVLAERAQALARAADGRFDGEPAQLLSSALQLDPGNTLALWLSGVAAQQKGDQALATERWRAALATVPADSAVAEAIRGALGQSGELAEKAAVPPVAAGDTRIKVSVRLDPKFAHEFAAETPVFVFARAINGPRMPLAVVRTTVGRLPQTVTLDDSQALASGAKLSAFRQVRVVARVSPDGEATPKAGNVQGSSGPIRTDADKPVTLVMNSRI